MSHMEQNFDSTWFEVKDIKQFLNYAYEILFWEFYEGGGKKAVLKGKWKGIRLNTFRNPDGPIELYDITADISEQKNVASEHPDVVADMARIMKEEHEDLK